MSHTRPASQSPLARAFARPSPLAKLRPILRSPALWSAAAFAAGGIGFAAGNLLLARVLPEEEFGRVALFLVLTQLGMVVGPLGIETITNRYRLHASPALLGRVSVSGTCAGVLLGAVAYVHYGFDAALASVLVVTVLGAVVNRVAGAFFQARHRFGTSLFLILIHNWVVLVAVAVVLWFESPSALPAALTVAAGYLVLASLGWWKSFDLAAADSPSSGAPHGTLLKEGLAVVGMQLAVAALYQLDRLLIPTALSIRDLATYSVAAAIAASPFRMLQTGIGYALLPRLRACGEPQAARRLLRHEIAIAALACVVSAIAVLLFTPWLIRLLLENRYNVSTGLLYALVIVGFVRVWSGISSATVAALGSATDLGTFNLYGWLALLIAAACALAGSAAGLVGVVYGMGAGWLALASAGTVIGLRAVARRASSGAPR